MKNPKAKAVAKNKRDHSGLTRIYLCDNPISRLRGIFFRKGFTTQHGVLLRRCSSVHSVGLRRSLFVIFLDGDERILSIQELPPNRKRAMAGAQSVLEVDAASDFVNEVRVGDQLDFGHLLDRAPSVKSCKRQSVRSSQAGASMVEFLIVAPIIIYFGVGVIQFGLIYHARNVVDYATFEAARTGAVHQADPAEMRRELTYRMGPVFGGDGSATGVRRSIQESVVAVNDPLRTRIRIINPTAAAFEDFGIVDPKTGKTVLPNAHLQHRATDIGSHSGVNIQDANLLKIEVTHGYELKLPWFNLKLPGTELALKQLMTRADPENAVFYARGQIPIRAVATVRMQSEAIANNVSVEGPGSSRPDTDFVELIASNAASMGGESEVGKPISQSESEECVGPSGLPNNLAIESLADNEEIAQCAISNQGVDETAVEHSVNCRSSDSI